MTFGSLLGLFTVPLVCVYAFARVRLAYADTGAKHPALHTAKYLLGSFFAVTTALIILLLANAANCFGGTRAIGTLNNDVTCSVARRWYSVLTDWQSAIGAFVGLLGLAWSTLLNALMVKSVRIEGN